VALVTDKHDLPCDRPDCPLCKAVDIDSLEPDFRADREEKQIEWEKRLDDRAYRQNYLDRGNVGKLSGIDR